MRKRILAMILTVCMFLTTLPASVFADTVVTIASGRCGTDVTWTLTDQGTLTISGSGDMDGYSASNSPIAEKAPWSSYGVKKVIIEDGVDTIGEAAFYRCYSLEEVVLPDKMSYINSSAFNYCSELTSIKIPYGIPVIRRNTFYQCYRLKSVEISASVACIEQGAFGFCQSLKQLLVPATVETIETNAFLGCKDLTLIGASGSKAETYANQDGFAFMEHEHEWDNGDNDNLSCADVNHVTYTCTGCFGTESQDITVPHDMILVEGVAHTCTADGNIAYYNCSECGKYFLDELGEMEVNIEDTVVKAAHDLTKIEAKAETCEDDGNIEYYKCESCQKLFLDENAAAETSLEQVIIGKLGHKLAKVDARTELCIADGSPEHYQCERCKEVFQDENATIKTRIVHALVRTAAKPASCTEAGNIEYWACSRCQKLFRDANGIEEITVNDTIIKANGHKLTLAQAKAATCTQDGNLAYYHCSACNNNFGDAAGTKIVSNVTVKASGHKYSTKTTKATTKADGGTAKICSNCGDKTAASTYYKIGTVKLSKTTYSYTGKVQSPKVTIKDRKGGKISSSNYTVTYSDKKSKKVGKYKVTIKFKGKKYSGSKTLYYTILPAKVTLSAVSSEANGQLTVKWKKKAGIDGYQIRYAKKSSMSGSKTQNVKGTGTTQYTIKNLIKGQKYYVQVRGYKKSSGKTYYSSWSKKKSAKTLNAHISDTSLSLEPGQTRTLKIIGSKQAVSWSTSNSAVASVNSAGTVTAIADGTATITATCGGVSYSCKVTVKTASSFDKLYDYINNYGSLNSSYNRFIKYTYYDKHGTNWNLGIVFDRSSNQFEFICTNTDGGSVTMSIGRNGSATTKCEFTYVKGYYAYCGAYAYVDVSSFTDDTNLNFLFEDYTGATQEVYNGLANAAFQLGMGGWGILLLTKVGLSWSDLGFTSY